MATIWSGDTGHIGIHGGVDGRTVVKTKFSRTDGLAYFLTRGARRAELRYHIISFIDSFITGTFESTNDQLPISVAS